MGYMGAETAVQLQNYVTAARNGGQPAPSLFGLSFISSGDGPANGLSQPTDPVWNLDISPIVLLWVCWHLIATKNGKWKQGGCWIGWRRYKRVENGKEH